MKHWKGGLLAVVVTTILLFVYYAHQIIGADYLTYGIWGDGYKNYYTLAYYLKFDTGAHFSGMNYPYGENILFTDNQPAFAWILKGISFIFPAVSNHIHAFIAIGFFISLIVSAIIIYKTFVEFDVDEFNAALFSTLIVMLSPQIQRLGGHFSLSYTFFIPLILYLLIKFLRTHGNWKYFAALLVFNSFFVFVHIYYAAMSAMFILLVAGTYALANRGNIKTHVRTITLMGVVAITPFILLKAFLFITDPITDRPKAPWGFIENRSTIADILLHPYTFTGEFLRHNFPNARIVYHFEGMGYIGVIAILSLATGLIVYIKNKNRAQALKSLYPFNLFIIPALIVLLFALAFPFCLDPVEKYYVKMPGAIKQFRASGRFNWFFYYNAVIFACLLIYRLFKQLLTRNKPLAYALLVAVYSIWFIEANMISNHQGDDYKSNSVELDEAKGTRQLVAAIQHAGKQVSDYQAILPIPVFLNGSEKLYIESDMAYDAMKASLFTGLPIACGQLSRTSQSQSFKLANLLSGPFIRKEILDDYPNKKPLLIMTHGNDLQPQEKALLAKATYLFTFENNNYFQLDLSAFRDSIGATKQYFAQNSTKFIQHGNYFSTDSAAGVIYKPFDDEPKSYAIFGAGAHYSEHEQVFFYFDTLPAHKVNSIYEVSYWVYTDSRRAAYPVMYMTLLDSTGKQINLFDSNAKFSTNTYGDWVYQSFYFRLDHPTDKILLTGSGDYASFDEIMVRPKSTQVVTHRDKSGSFVFNNFPIR